MEGEDYFNLVAGTGSGWVGTFIYLDCSRSVYNLLRCDTWSGWVVTAANSVLGVEVYTICFLTAIT